MMAMIRCIGCRGKSLCGACYPVHNAGVDVVQRSSAKLAVLAAISAATTVTASYAQTSQRGPQWPVTLQQAQPAAQPGRPAPAIQSAPAAAEQIIDEHSAQAAGPDEAAQPELGWTEGEIDAARARCNVIIAQYDADATPVGAMRDGDCGSPHPVNLTRVGSVTLSQPATVNCEVIAALGDWLKVDVQPAARQLIGSRVTGLQVLSSYSCRNAYGRKRTRLSEHGRANAIDIKAFQFERKQVVDLLGDWGMTERDIRARILAAEAAAKAQAIAKAKAEAEAQAKAVAEARARRKAPGQGTDTATTDSGAGQEQALGLAGSSDGLISLRGMVRETFGKAGEDRNPSALSLEQPSRLGGPTARDAARDAARKVAPVTEPGPAPATGIAADPVPGTTTYNAQQQFLRAIHAAACRRFGTVLGPEANDAHRNHFHLDMADRGGRGSYCR